MAKAPISQTVILTEDGSGIPVVGATLVTIPPVVLATVDNTLASSDRLAATVIGAGTLFDGLYARLTAIAGRGTSLRTRRLALTTRIAALES